MATLSKKFKKSNKSKSSSRSRKHFNKSRKNGLKTKKMMRGGATMPKKQGRMSKIKGWFMKPKPKPAPAPAMKPTVMAQPVTVQPVTNPLRKLNLWEDPVFMNSVAKIKNGMPEPEPAPYVPEKYVSPLEKQRARNAIRKAEYEKERAQANLNPALRNATSIGFGSLSH